MEFLYFAGLIVLFSNAVCLTCLRLKRVVGPTSIPTDPLRKDDRRQRWPSRAIVEPASQARSQEPTMSQSISLQSPAARASHPAARIWTLGLGSIGVVYGDKTPARGDAIAVWERTATIPYATATRAGG
jgi:hypothetical protein